MANPFVGYGLTLITFYLTGSKATKFKSGIKAQLETHPTPRDGKKRDVTSGNRNAIQVVCNSATGVVACLAFRILNAGLGDVDPLGKQVLKVVGGVRVSNLMLTLMVGGHYAACMGDTLGSELGILSKSQPRLITSPWRSVPKGTNGAISPLGLFVSALGGTLIGTIQSLCLFAHYHYFSTNQTSPSNCWKGYAKLIALLTASGLFGSLVDSLLGATLQQTLYNEKSKKILVGTAVDVRDGYKSHDATAQWVKVTGCNVLDNNAVNFLASASAALTTAWIGVKLF
ncbi:uncharacterized protein UTRI_06473_B [Ustilago trichophora]|uniref:Transmembrane protein 19 n=1 Tax=Ustilago trichophora TaxID=86804 RepID=A0A5C3EN82_9BASI|nr:uncharacterized protein UTRI_06473_B [Ustilago trichophora]